MNFHFSISFYTLSLFIQQHDMDVPIRSTVDVNVIYSYTVIVETSNIISKQENWLTTEKVRALKFSPHWVKGMLNRAELRRRRITTDEKKTLPIAEIIRILKIGQDLITLYGHDPSTIWNMDETAITYAIGPTHLYVPRDQARAANIGNVNTNLRITAVLTVNGLEFYGQFVLVLHFYRIYILNRVLLIHGLICLFFSH